MAKFVGIVNGKLFDNEKEFSNAVSDAIKAKDGLLSITSYYTSDSNDVKTDVETKTEPTKIDKQPTATQTERVEKDETKLDSQKQNDVPEKDYVITDGENKDYEITLNLYNKLITATNKDEIRKVVSKVKDDIDAETKKTNDTIKDIKIKIDNLNDDLYTAEEKIDDLYDRKRYYNHILDIIGSNPNQYSRPLKKYNTDSFWDILDIYNFLK